MLYLAGVCFGVIVTDTDTLEECRQHFVAIVGVPRNLGSFICQCNVAVSIHIDETFFTKLFHCYADAGLRITKLIDDVN